jgi:hypothetical protein
MIIFLSISHFLPRSRPNSTKRCIKDEELWLRALRDRNSVAHSYHENIALGIVKLVKSEFYDMFGELQKEIKTVLFSLISLLKRSAWKKSSHLEILIAVNYRLLDLRYICKKKRRTL